MIGVWRDGGGDTDAGPGARDGGSRAGAGPSELDLTYAQSQVLFYVAEHPGAHMGDVAKAFGVTLPAVTHIVDRLEQKAFLVRGDHPADRRIYMLDLTRAGKALVEELHAMRLRV